MATSKPRRHTIEMYSSAMWPWPLTSDLENLFINARSRGEYSCHVSLKSVHRIQRYWGADGRRRGLLVAIERRLSFSGHWVGLALYTVTYQHPWCVYHPGGRREDYQNCSVLYCVLKLCTVISTVRWTVLTVLWMGFVTLGSLHCA